MPVHLFVKNRVNVNNITIKNRENNIKTVRTELNEREKELVNYLVMDCKNTGEIHEKLKRLFAGTIKQ